jgi:hypothetical protein
MKHWCALLTIALSLSAGAARAQESTVDSLALARQYTMWLYVGEVDSLLAHSTEATREEEAREPSFARLSRLIAERAGFETEVIEETWKLRNGDCQYWRTAEFSNSDEPLLIRWVLDSAGRIEGIGGGPLSQAPPVEAETCQPG